MKISETQEKVKKILIDEPLARDSDEYLYICYLEDTLKVSAYAIVYGDVADYVRNGTIASYDTITRSRRKLQEKEPSLRGRMWNKRHELQKEVKKDLGYHVSDNNYKLSFN